MKPFKVAQVNEYIAKKLREDLNLRGLPVEGEVSGFSKSGIHYYFTLKDADSMIKCAIWGTNARNIDMKLVENGKKIVVIGDISPYPKGGNYSLSVRHVEAAGEGDLMAEFNRIKAKLEEEGLFKPEFKKPIPAFPYRVGIVTSATGAAIEDIKKIITSKNDFTDILIFPTQVQGISAPASIVSNIELANNLAINGLRIDTLIVGRGGGSAEDLAAFNDENVARAIFASKIPIISAVGHESDFSISDFVADVRAETPTAAADMAVMNTFELKDMISGSKEYLLESIKLKIDAERNLLESRSDLLYSNMKAKINEARSSLEKAIITINENNPQNIFNKGYAAVLDTSGKIMPSIDNIAENEEYRVQMKDGSFNAVVKSVERS
ncbi:MAG: exodeoxyribonuclease VII large subunit [Clostridiales bacterium]|nr:exodeoxyribonuclease VII large subunit [Candidatus Crickella equi]